MIAENFNRNGYVANKHRQGSDLWFETIGKHERVSHYETRKMSGVGYTSTLLRIYRRRRSFVR